MVNRKDLNPDASAQAAFGARLRSSREVRGWTQDDLSARMGISSGHISGVETTRKSPSLRFAKAADGVFGMAGMVDTFERQWHEMHNGSLLEGYPEYVGYEARAAEIRLFESGLIPGLLQTPEYAAALEASNVRRGSITAEQAQERVTFLIERQAALARPLPPLLFVVLDESCIRRPIGGHEVMDRQLARLVEFAEESNTVFQLAPYAIGEERPFNRLVNLLTLSDRSVFSYVESQTHGHLDRELNSVVPLLRAYHQMQAHALSQAASVDMITQTRKGTL
ncbi:helix-turn-helix domain-containing protein [Streptomyces albipurpureus]|uniref:Helix-turn-helix transcriptional regulator n=1 Tax=Streptomyces albipurpureus TaxID=2897419 RepID=A0ABT0UVY9_9ACTN|nr:helix-turn-helix transcriptional regulator [Streptomyces sp. CWNU-1]MCM2392567.1 helix-turn-helix transcriptional regulator [Streptomyces sp. CWNU-1]